MTKMLLDHLLEAGVLTGLLVGMVMLSRLLIRKIPVLAESRSFNIAEDKVRMAKPKYRPVVKQNQRIGTLMMLPLLLLVVPLFSSFDPLPWWRYITDPLAIYAVYDFMYYLTHRFLFHGVPYFKRVHGLHHQARNPSHIDSQYVHPLETFLGLMLLYIAITTIGLLPGDFHIASMAVCLFIYTQINILNHADVQIDKKPWTIATWISRKHHNHHIDMHHGNYATIILLYDWLFGTYE